MPSMPMENNPAWKGGRTIARGYVRVMTPGHPRAHNGYVYEHILVAERVLGKPLPDGAIVHHVNENPGDNRPENLVILQGISDHRLLHRKLRALKATGDARQRVCVFCGEHDQKENMTENITPRQVRYFHRACANACRRESRARKRAL